MTDKLHFNGINGDTGEYLFEPVDIAELVQVIKGQQADSGLQKWLKRIHDLITNPFLGLPIGVDPAEPAQAGWGVILHKDEDPAVKQVIAKLVDHRRKQLGEAKVKELMYLGSAAEDYRQFLARYGVGLGDVEPTKVPYYLLIVGHPEQIPFSFGQNLDVEYAVGRLHFDTPQEYDNYVQSIIAYETLQNPVPNAKEAVFFGTRHEFDLATQLSADHLVAPLINGIPENNGIAAQPGIAQKWGFRLRHYWGQHATKAELSKIFAATATGSRPAFLFTATHGMGWLEPHPQQKTQQGALVCQDWPGFGGINPHHYFAASDLPKECHIHGLISFNFACYGAGTPRTNRFVHKAGEAPSQIASEAFFAALPKALLAHPNGGALACIGHIERAWGSSIRPLGLATAQLQPFQNTIGRIMIGQPVGYAMKDFNERYASLSTYISEKLEQAGFGAAIPEDELSVNWIERNDAQGYAVIGDPAVRLRIHELQL